MPEELNQGQEEVLEPQMEETQGELSNPEQPTDNPEEGELPEDAKERTRKEFEKLKAHNAELKRQLEERQNLPSVLDFLSSPSNGVPNEVRQQYVQPVQLPPVYPQYAPQPTPQPEPQLVDEQGYVNADVLKRELEEAKKARQRAEEAEKRAREVEERVSRFEINKETQELYQAYPELDPKSENFNQEFYDLTKNELTSQIINTGKRDPMTAAAKLSKYFRKAQPSQVEQQRQQASVSGSQPRPQANPDLRGKSDFNSIQARLKAIGA